MLDTYTKNATGGDAKFNNLAILQNPSFAYALHKVSRTRIFLFEQAGAKLSIDFVAHPAEASTLYIVPPHHYYHLSSADMGNFVCIDIDQLLLQPYHKQWLYALKYSTHKTLPPIDKAYENLGFSDLMEIAAKGIINETYLVTILTEWIKGRIPRDNLEKMKTTGYPKIELADKFQNQWC